MNRLYVMDVSCLEDPKIFEYWYEKMKPQRKDKIDAFKPEGSKRLSLGAGILLDRALEELGITEYELEKRENGKPYLKSVVIAEKKDDSDNTEDAGDVFFNLSHSGTKVALGISDKEIGVDIERERNFKESLIKRVFSEEERKLAEKMGKEKLMKENAENDDSEKTALNEAYTALWTAKESIMKYTGKGIALLPEKIELSEAEGGRLHVSIEGIESPDLRLTLYPMDENEHSTEGYSLCVCSEYEEFEYREVLLGE